MVKFSDLFPALVAVAPQEPRAYHYVAARFYLGVDSLAELQAYAQPRPVCRGVELPPVLSPLQVDSIIRNR